MAARIVKENQAGIVVEPEKVENFINSATQLYQDLEQRNFLASNGRAYAEENFEIEQITNRFEEAIF